MPVKDRWFYKITESYLVFSPFGYNAPVETIGIDIGTKHLGICGLSKSEDREHPVATWWALVSVPTKNIHESVDLINDLLFKEKDFAFFREPDIRYIAIIMSSDCDRYRIELQVQQNPGARAVACALRTFTTMLQFTRGESRQVAYVHGERKYAIAPKFSEKAREDPLRKQIISGQSNTKKRKVLGFNDVMELLKLNGETSSIKFLLAFEQFVDQLYDMTDANLVGRDPYYPGIKITRAKKDGKNQDIDFDSFDFDSCEEDELDSEDYSDSE